MAPRARSAPAPGSGCWTPRRRRAPKRPRPSCCWSRSSTPASTTCPWTCARRSGPSWVPCPPGMKKNRPPGRLPSACRSARTRWAMPTRLKRWNAAAPGGRCCLTIRVRGRPRVRPRPATRPASWSARKARPTPPATRSCTATRWAGCGCGFTSSRAGRKEIATAAGCASRSATPGPAWAASSCRGSARKCWSRSWKGTSTARCWWARCTTAAAKRACRPRRAASRPGRIFPPMNMPATTRPAPRPTLPADMRRRGTAWGPGTTRIAIPARCGASSQRSGAATATAGWCSTTATANCACSWPPPSRRAN